MVRLWLHGTPVEGMVVRGPMAGLDWVSDERHVVRVDDFAPEGPVFVYVLAGHVVRELRAAEVSALRESDVQSPFWT